MRRRRVVGLGRTAEILAWEDNKVLKLFRNGWPLSAVKAEEKIARTVSEAGLSVPAVYGVVKVKGRYGILCDRVNGPSMLKELMFKPEKLENFANLFAELHADMHSVEVDELPSQHQRIEAKIRRTEPLTSDLKQAALEALHRLPSGDVLTHGDFHPDNILMPSHGPMIIDWNDATKGRPEADIARTLYLLQKGRPHQPFNLDSEEIDSVRTQFVKVYLKRYRQIRSISIEEIESWRLPVIAARLSEGIKEEKNEILSILKRMCSAKAKHTNRNADSRKG